MTHTHKHRSVNYSKGNGRNGDVIVNVTFHLYLLLMLLTNGDRNNAGMIGRLASCAKVTCVCLCNVAKNGKKWGREDKELGWGCMELEEGD